MHLYSSPQFPRWLTDTDPDAKLAWPILPCHSGTDSRSRSCPTFLWSQLNATTSTIPALFELTKAVPEKREVWPRHRLDYRSFGPLIWRYILGFNIGYRILDLHIRLAYSLSKFHDFAQRHSIPNIRTESGRREKKNVDFDRSIAAAYNTVPYATALSCRTCWLGVQYVQCP